jgi:hypothetical protein
MSINSRMLGYVFLAISVFSIPAFADLTVTGESQAPAYVNTNQTVVMMNLTLSGTVTVNWIDITFSGTAGIGNVSEVRIYNDTNNDAAYDVGEELLGNATISNETNTANISVTIVSPETHHLLIVYKIHNKAIRLLTVNASISEASITANETVTAFSVSAESQIQDLRAEASMSPTYVDTGVINQTLIYNITTTGSDYINKTRIVLPSGYTIVNVTRVTINGSNQTQSCPTPSGGEVCAETVGTEINITYPGSGILDKAVRIYISVNTSSTAVSVQAVNSTITGGNFTNITTDVYSAATDVITKQLIIIENSAVIKSTALKNGTDYWEFNFTLNITANVSGLVQFRMNSWNNSAGNIINLTNQTVLTNVTTYYASLRRSDEPSNIFNVTSSYRDVGASLTSTENSLYNFVLRMIIPSTTPIASDWWTTYWTLFRSTPS